MKTYTYEKVKALLCEGCHPMYSPSEKPRYSAKKSSRKSLGRKEEKP